jgi:hypothetical protein
VAHFLSDCTLIHLRVLRCPQQKRDSIWVFLLISFSRLPLFMPPTFCPVNLVVFRFVMTRQERKKIPAKTCVQSPNCQMVCFQTKKPNLGKFWRALEWQNLVYSMAIWNILRPFCTIYGHFVQFMAILLFSGNLVYFYPFWYNKQRKIWQPWRIFTHRVCQLPFGNLGPMLRFFKYFR